MFVWCRYVMNFIFLAFPVLPSLGMPEFPSTSQTPSHQPGLHLPHPHRWSSSFRALRSGPPPISFFLTCQTFPVFDQRVALECVSTFCHPNVLMSNDQYSSASSLPKDHLSRTTDVNSTAIRVLLFSKTGANRLIPRPRASSPLPNK